MTSILLFHWQEAQDVVADQGWPRDRWDLLPDVSVTGLYRDRLLRCHVQRTGQGEREVPACQLDVVR